MFTAKDIEYQQEIVILSPTWSKRLDELRQWSHHDRLVCPMCARPVTVKAGTLRRQHFAHRHKAGCNYGEDDPALSRARTVLYGWLVGKFGEKVVSLEKPLNDIRLPRPIDCWVQRSQRDFAYWLIHKNVRPNERDDIQAAFEDMDAQHELQRDIHVNWVFLKDMLRVDEETPERVYLNPTERELMRNTQYDAPAHELPDLETAALRGVRKGNSLHYLDVETGRVTTYRGLHLYHEPQAYSGLPVTTPLVDLLVAPRTGEFVHPGEHQRSESFAAFMEQVNQRRMEIEREETARQRRYHASQGPRWGHSDSSLQGSLSFSSAKPQKSPDTPESSRAPLLPDVGICIFCGEETTDWWQYKDGACRCRSCLAKGLA